MPLNGQAQPPESAGLDLSAFDGLLQIHPQPLLVGGQAVNLWAQVFLQENSELKQMQPFLSGDCDLFGTQELLLELGSNTGWKVIFSPKAQASPVVGYLVKQDADGRQLLVEVLHSLKGLMEEDLRKEVSVQLGDRVYRTLSPLVLLKAKLANLAELPQNSPGQERNDAKHVRILIECLSAYLKQALAQVKAGKFTERSLINLLEETLALINSDHGSRISSAEGIDLTRCFPPDLNASGLPKVENFLQHRIHRTGRNLVP